MGKHSLGASLAAALSLVSSLAAAQPQATFTNPVLPGFHPDPSIVRVGPDYYLITSSFEYFPGVPIFHSRDLVAWQPIGHVLDRPSQLDLDGVASSDGIYAPTIRHHKGTFYMVTTLVARRKPKPYVNFIVTAKNPAGPWSDPFVVADSHFRIDPSLFFDDDGKVWFQANRDVRPAPYPGHRFITIQELDARTMKLVGEPVDIGEGHGRTAATTEAPHIFKKDGYYYLLVAEGGTFEGHAVTISRSRKITGPYEQYQHNPIFSHRQLGPGMDIHSVGHADIVETPQGEFWMVALGMRGVGGHCCNLGRETFLVPMIWPKGQWPVVAPGVGRVRAVEPRPKLPVWDRETRPASDQFEGKQLGFEWNFVRTPRGDFWSLERRPGHLRLALKKEQLGEETNPAFVGRRIQHADFSARARLEFAPGADGEAAGLVLRSGNNDIKLMKARAKAGDVLRLSRRVAGKEAALGEVRAPAGPVTLKVDCRREVDCRFFFAAEPERWTPIGGTVDGRVLGHKNAPGAMFTGAYVGLYATSAGAQSGNHADYDWFEYKPE